MKKKGNNLDRLGSLGRPSFRVNKKGARNFGIICMISAAFTGALSIHPDTRKFLYGDPAVQSELPGVKKVDKYWEAHQDQGINEKFHSFPESKDLYDIKKVEKIWVDDAKKVLVHIRQKHYWSIDQRLDMDISKIQSEIYRIIEFLGVSKVYMEGFEFDGMDLGEKSENIRKMYDARFGPIALERDTGINLEGAETVEANLKGLVCGFNQIIRSLFSCEDNILDNREDVFLEILDKDITDFSVVVYGGGHDWSNNVLEWNKDNPEHKIALISVTPRSYDDGEE